MSKWLAVMSTVRSLRVPKVGKKWLAVTGKVKRFRVLKVGMASRQEDSKKP